MTIDTSDSKSRLGQKKFVPSSVEKEGKFSQDFRQLVRVDWAKTETLATCQVETNEPNIASITQ